MCADWKITGIDAKTVEKIFIVVNMSTDEFENETEENEPINEDCAKNSS